MYKIRKELSPGRRTKIKARAAVHRRGNDPSGTASRPKSSRRFAWPRSSASVRTACPDSKSVATLDSLRYAKRVEAMGGSLSLAAEFPDLRSIAD